MVVKAVTLFLIGIAVLAMFGRLRVRRRSAAPCPACGRHRIGHGPCPCGHTRKTRT